jgi:selenide,water dikinase
MDTFAGGAYDNRRYFRGQVEFASSLDDTARMMLYDPQTSGGLLLAVPPAVLSGFLERARELDQPAWEVGEAVEGSGIMVTDGESI